MTDAEVRCDVCQYVPPPVLVAAADVMPVKLDRECEGGPWRVVVEGMWGDRYSFDDSTTWDAERALSACEKWLARTRFVRVAAWVPVSAGHGHTHCVYRVEPQCTVCGGDIVAGGVCLIASPPGEEDELPVGGVRGVVCPSLTCTDEMLKRLRAYADSAQRAAAAVKLWP